MRPDTRRRKSTLLRQQDTLWVDFPQPHLERATVKHLTYVIELLYYHEITKDSRSLVLSLLPSSRLGLLPLYFLAGVLIWSVYRCHAPFYNLSFLVRFYSSILRLPHLVFNYP